MISKLKIYTSDLSKIRPILNKYGVAVLTNYFNKTYADEVFSSVKQWLINLDIGLTNDTKTWTNANLPMGPRYGMYQSIISNCPKFWELREHFFPIFAHILDETELITSIDGASFYPTIMGPKSKEDWAHIDQTVCSDFMCYQSQFVATDTSASFVCTPESHLKHKLILKKFAIKTDKDFYKFTSDNVIELKKMFGSNYQIPIKASKGSVIFWDSRTIHSSKYADVKDDSWRSVFYISMRPEYILTSDNLQIIQQAVIQGKTTNHCGTIMFKPYDRFKQKNIKITNLEKVSNKLSYYWFLSPIQKKICGFPNEIDEFRVIKENCIILLVFCLEENLIDEATGFMLKNFAESCLDLVKIRFLQNLLLIMYNHCIENTNGNNSHADSKKKMIIINV